MASWNVRLDGFDQRLLLAVLSLRKPSLTRVMRIATVAGDPPVIVPLAALLAAGALPGITAAGREALVMLVVSHLLVQMVKRLASRPRPSLPIGIDSVVRAPDRFSFPSGHATAALAVGIPLAGALPVVLAVPVVATAVLTGVSRCYLGIHYPGDVLAGWGLAVATWAAIPA